MAAEVRGYDRLTGLPHASRSVVIVPHGMAATSQPLATGIALDILKTSGSAVDAAIASFGGYQAILRDHAEGVWHGASEVRKDGQAAGY